MQKNSIVEVSTPSDKNGDFNFYSLQPGGDYYIIEVLPPEGYALNDEVFHVEVADDGNGMVIFNTNQPLTVTDYALGQLTVKKITKLMGTEYLVDGVKFNTLDRVL